MDLKEYDKYFTHFVKVTGGSAKAESTRMHFQRAYDLHKGDWQLTISIAVAIDSAYKAGLRF